MTDSQDVAFVGLGIMGYPMAGHLARAGHRVCVYNRTAARADAWMQDYEGRTAPTPRQAAEGAEIVFMCVGNDDDVRSVSYGDDGIFAGPGGCDRGDHTTASASLRGTGGGRSNGASVSWMRRSAVARQGQRTGNSR